MRNLAEHFALYLFHLKAVIAPRRHMKKERFDFLAFLWHRLWSIEKRFAKLYARWKNGTLPKQRGPRPGRTRKPRPAPAQGKVMRLPAGRMWLIKDMQETAFAGSQLRHLIATTPELHEFLKAAPQARRLLNPICHMLGVDFEKPYGVPLVKPAAVAEPQSTAKPPLEPPGLVEGAAQSTSVAPTPPVVFSSA